MGRPSWGQAFMLGDLLWLHLGLAIRGHQVERFTKLKGSWLNLGIVSPRGSEFGDFFLDPGHVLDFMFEVSNCF